MRRLWVIFALLALSSALSAQSVRKIKEDPSFIWGEGRGTDYESTQSAALDALVAKLASTDLLDVPERSKLAVWQTYRGDILSVSEVVMESGTALRYIPWKDVDRIFARRLGLVAELHSRGAKALSGGREGEAAACAGWALTLLDVLPGNPDLKAELEIMAGASAIEPKAEVPGLSYVGREVESIRSALGKKASIVRKEAVSRPVTSVNSNLSADPEPVARPNLAALPVIDRGLLFKGADFRGLYEIGRLSTVSASMAASGEPLVKPATTYLLMLQAGALPSVEAGLFIGVKRNALGGYLSARRGFGTSRHDYSASSDGRTDYGFLWASGKTGSSRYSVSGGVLIGFGEKLIIYAGAGYGKIDCLWEDTSGQWARIEDLSHRGGLVELGLIYSIGPFSIQAGASSISFSTISPVLGLGVNF